MTYDYNTATDAPSSGAITLPLSALLESLLFVADGPVPIAQFAAALEATPRTIEAALEELEAIYQHRGLRIQRDKAGIQLTTAPQTAEAVEKFLGLESLQRLSRPAVETLAIIAYQQPITRPRIEAIRGVNSDGVIKSLLTKGLIEEMGRTDGPGRPVLYGTTPAFLQHFGLSSLTDLPPLDIEAVLAAARITGPESEAAPAPQSEPETEATATGETGEPVAQAAEPAPTDAPLEAEAETLSEPATPSEVENALQASEAPELNAAPELEAPAMVEELPTSQLDSTGESAAEADDDEDDEWDDEDDDDDDWDDEDEEDDDENKEGTPDAPVEPES